MHRRASHTGCRDDLAPWSAARANGAKEVSISPEAVADHLSDQNRYESLNPRHNVAQAILRAISAFERAGGYSSADLDFRLDSVRLPRSISRRYPAELSGGERQRVAIAGALAATPETIVCDEITSALDVSIQAAVVELLHQRRMSMDLSLLFITHDVGPESS